METETRRGRARTIVERVVARAGGQSALARHIGIRPQSVQNWVVKAVVPPLRVLACERASGIPRWQIRPDIYPPPDQASP